MLPFGFADALSSTLDFYTLWQTVRVSAVGMLGEALKGKF
jgi:C-8 sterol isomerase